MSALDDRYDFRCTKSSKVKFKATCKKFDVEDAEFIREIIDAVNEGRLRIKPRKNQLRTIKGIHHD